MVIYLRLGIGREKFGFILANKNLGKAGPRGDPLATLSIWRRMMSWKLNSPKKEAISLISTKICRGNSAGGWFEL